MNNRFMSRFMGAACFMSAVGAENPASTPSAADTNEKEMADMREKFGKKDKIVALANDDQALFADFVSSFGDNVHDWTEGVDPAVFTGLALTKSDNGTIRLLPIPSEEAVFANPSVRKSLYKQFVNRVVNAGTEDDASAAQFVVVDGNFKQKYDVDAFKFLGKIVVKFLRDQGLTGITINGLRQSFASQAFAQTQFPRTTKAQWEQILGMAEALAKKNDYDTGLYDHWKATRDVQTADTSTLNLDFSKLQEAEDTLEQQIEAEKNKPAETATA